MWEGDADRVKVGGCGGGEGRGTLIALMLIVVGGGGGGVNSCYQYVSAHFSNLFKNSIDNAFLYYIKMKFFLTHSISECSTPNISRISGVSSMDPKYIPGVKSDGIPLHPQPSTSISTSA
ncbi:hypothetical protein LOAG_13321, partial [Loa loa]